MQGMRVQDLLIPEESPRQDSAAKGKNPANPGSAVTENKYFVIEFIHDTICPFCYIGMKNLLMAIDIYKSKHSDAVFEVTYSPPYPPYTLRAPDLPVTIPQPRGPALQMRLLDAITTNYHEHDKDLSDPQFLLDVARVVTGFSNDELRAVLDSPEWDRTIDTLSHEVQNRLSVRSQSAGPIVAVPTMVLNNRWVYGGFQKVDEIVEQFDLIRRGINPLQEYTTSSLVLDGGIADTIAREAALAKSKDNTGGRGGNSGGGSSIS
ncbi:hypothetical protein NUW58_g8973 [Xylaria curta]|uniref:Uncharacterized protein n=1 Tax=Xylaria curta TaxID=42375 RepID=A0ACC1N367_9PEZI|nr:hypothetical protein NUW58_g8973 [Xylaria curta]